MATMSQTWTIFTAVTVLALQLCTDPPEQPKNISCTYKVINNETGDVLCTWNRGRDTYLRDSSVLCVRTLPGNHTDGLETCRDSSKGTTSPSASFSVSSSVEQISVWVQATNQLGSAVSVTINYNLSDIGKTAAVSVWCFAALQLVRRECVSCFMCTDNFQLVRVRHQSGAASEDSAPGDPIQIRGTELDLVSRLRHADEFGTGVDSLLSAALHVVPFQSQIQIQQWPVESVEHNRFQLDSRGSITLFYLFVVLAPARELDVWYASDLKSLRVYWKEANISITRGKIIEYKVKVYSPNSDWVIRNLSADARNYSIPLRANCEVTVWAFNSKGSSPPAKITTSQSKASPPQDVQVTADNQSVAISWRKTEGAWIRATVVEWYPQGRKMEELRWVRLGRDEGNVVITGIKPFECYEGAVNVIYKDSSASRTGFTGVTTGKSVPAAGPSFDETVEGNKVKVTWTEIPRADRRGCITKYNIYLEDSSRQRKLYSVPASERTYIIKDLSSPAYSVWMTASTSEGEGPASQKLKIFIQQETQLSVILVCVVFPILFLLCVCQSSAVKRRFCVFFQCLLLEVPDPANSKWAKECTKEKGKMNLQLQLSNSTVNEGEEEPILVDVEELPRQSSDTQTPADVTPHLHPQTSLSHSMEPVTPLYPPTTYIKSFSHDSDSSDHTQTSMDTNTTAYYISSHGLGTMDEEDFQEDEEEDGEFVNKLGFFPSDNIFTEPLDFGGKLTLDAVKINCNDFF
ncbi:hypothetical protein L3Q82_025903 [Scortum barcoo]|uniref:Uncharacterized protein n=1 Tax=Scortum barcoo TaxID=214431 RepID=A0ACB8WNR5_9TELE|nr:hypothetical protein L3Q82_025903 [Scortum barcoo]